MNNNDEVKVSVICTTYNHEKYIAQALESFLAQITDFKFEILVHDDLSTDSTESIVRKYESEYPEMIRAFYEVENQYSKGISIMRTILIPEARGKYMAICEGDDYWTDVYKLQKQVDYMERHPKCSLCIHASEIVDSTGNRIQLISPQNESGKIDADKLIRGGGGFIATNSILTPMYLAKNTPSYFDILSIDYVWQMYLASKGDTYYIAEIMSAYRKGVEGSWSARTEFDKNGTIVREGKKRTVLEEFSRITNNKYEDAIKYRIRESKFIEYMWSRDRTLGNSEDVREFKKEIPKREFVSIWMRSHCPILFSVLNKLNYYRKRLSISRESVN